MIPTDEQWIEKLHSLKGMPYRHQGSARDGADCIGGVLMVCLEFGLDLRSYDMPDRPWVPPARTLLLRVKSACNNKTVPWQNRAVGLIRNGSIGSCMACLCGVLPDGRKIMAHGARDLMMWELREIPESHPLDMFGIWALPFKDDRDVELTYKHSVLRPLK